MDTILVVDDEKVIRDGCSRLLSAESYRVLTAEDGQVALDVLACETVDLVLCDLKMPVMGAFEVLEAINGRYPGLPLVVITGHGTVATAVECMKLGAYDFVTKPFKVEHLLLIVKRALEKQVLERQARELQAERSKNLYDLAMEQSRIRTIINCMADGVLVTNRDLEVVLHNPALRRLLDLPLQPDRPESLSQYASSEGLVNGIKDLIEKAKGEVELLSQELQKGNTFLRALSGPIVAPSGEVLGSVTVFHDITRFKELDEMKSNFVHMVSHELRSPLSTIKQQLSVILEGMAGEVVEKQRQLLSRAHERIESLLELINDLLDIAKIESGHSMQEQVPLEIGPLLQDLAAFMKERAESRKITLALDLPARLPLIQADPRSMEEVFSNLISNAINYSPDGGRIAVSAMPFGGYLEILVSDTGVGIAPEELPKIFDKFYRVKHPKTRQVVGTGLGLSIVKGIIESHRGSIKAESEPGVGTTFRVLLPTV